MWSPSALTWPSPAAAPQGVSAPQKPLSNNNDPSCLFPQACQPQVGARGSGWACASGAGLGADACASPGCPLCLLGWAPGLCRAARCLAERTCGGAALG